MGSGTTALRITGTQDMARFAHKILNLIDIEICSLTHTPTIVIKASESVGRSFRLA